MTSESLFAQNMINLKSDQNYLQHLDTTQIHKFQESGDKLKVTDLAIGVVTIKRMYGKNELGYLTQVMTQFSKVFESDKIFNTKALFICDVYPGPGEHNEAIRLSKQFVRIARFPNASASAAIKDPFEKEKEDYAFCLQKALMYQPKYVLLVEDDTVPRPDLFKVIYHKTGKMSLPLSKDEIGYIKLYYPERWQGYGFEFAKLLELIYIGLAGGLLFLCLSTLHCGFPIPSRRCRSIRLFIFTVGFIYLTLVGLVIGRQHIIELRRLSETFYALADAPDCCTPAVLYPARSAGKFASHLSTVTCSNNFPLDFALENFMGGIQLKRYLIEPNLFKHIGLVSSTKGISRDLRDFVFALL